jgi:hypothetical protein
MIDETNWESVEKLIKPLHTEEGVHDWSTANRLARHIEYLANGCEPFDNERAKLLCWFHGIRDLAKDPAERRHWMRPLRSAGISLETQTWLWIALDRYLETPVTLEERIAHDAVMLERVGAVGVARAFMFGGETGRPLRECADYLRRQIGETVFLTPAGRRVGVRRIVYTRRFLKELEEE